MVGIVILLVATPALITTSDSEDNLAARVGDQRVWIVHQSLEITCWELLPRRVWWDTGAIDVSILLISGAFRPFLKPKGYGSKLQGNERTVLARLVFLCRWNASSSNRRRRTYQKLIFCTVCHHGVADGMKPMLAVGRVLDLAGYVWPIFGLVDDVINQFGG